ncbi:trp operon leader peptide [Streptomyces sp. ISL-11]|nr:trp operon leader peptide [Streptomyces sp. ISL-11]
MRRRTPRQAPGAPPSPPALPAGPVRPHRPSGRVRDMFAQTHQNWWWTAHPAAH